jgi:putative ABC transport system permease protein
MPYLYRSYDQSNETGAALLVETEGRPETAATSIRTHVNNIAPNMPIFDVRTMDSHFREVGLLEPRFLAQMLTAVGLVGMVLGVLGLYGVIAYSLGQRRYEMGIRMALGASNRQILRMTLLRGLASSGIASAVGCGLALTLRIRTFLPADSFVYVGVLLLMLIVTGAACYIPARRASMVDPNITLRSEL